MARINTYFQMAFLEAFFEKIFKINILDESVSSLLALYENMYELSDVHLNIDMDKFIEMSANNPILKKLYKSPTSNLLFLPQNKFPEKLEHLERINKIPSFFYYEKDRMFFDSLKDVGFWGSSCKLLEEKLKALTNLNQIIKVDEDPELNEFKGWKNIVDRIEMPMTDVIIADPYLLSESLDSVKKNVVPLLQNFIDHASKNKPCNFSILISKTDRNEIVIHSCISFLIKQFSKAANLTFYLIQPKFLHDRHILTNYFWIQSGHSFTFYSGRSKIYKNTTLQLRSIINSHSAHYKERKVLSDIKKRCPAKYILGEKIDSNRLWIK